MGIFNITNVQEAVKQEATPAKPPEPVVTPTVNTPVQGEGKEAGEKTVVMTGPLSKIYSEALNMVYSKESAMTHHANKLTAVDEDSNVQSDAYVYITDGDNMDGEELVGASDKLKVALDSKKYKDVLLAVECNTVNNKAVLLYDMATSMGAKVVFTKGTGLEKIKAALNEKPL